MPRCRRTGWPSMQADRTAQTAGRSGGADRNEGRAHAAAVSAESLREPPPARAGGFLLCAAPLPLRAVNLPEEPSASGEVVVSPAVPSVPRRRRARPARHLLRRHQRAAPVLFGPEPELPRSAHRAHVQQRIRLAAPDLRLGALGADDRVAARLRRLWQRGRLADAQDVPADRRRTDGQCVRDQPEQRAHVLDDEPRDGARRDDGHRVERGPALARLLPRQGGAAVDASRVAALQLPDGASIHGAALVSGRQRRVHGDLDGGRPRPRAGRLRRDGVSRHGARQRALLRPARPRVARHPRRFPGRRQRLSVRWALLHLARLRPLAREGRRLAAP